MQPEGPYRFTETLGECQVGRAWAALDGQDRPVTVAVLDGAAASDPRWREAFANAVNMLHQMVGGHRYGPVASPPPGAPAWAASDPDQFRRPLWAVRRNAVLDGPTGPLSATGAGHARPSQPDLT